MKLLKPNWVSHDGNPIFSLDIHPDGSRFATGGQGEGDSRDSGKVIIWNMAPVRSAKVEMNPDVPKVLCEMSNHLGCVNCVRWSVDGKFLASGGDDAIVIVWQIKYQGVGKMAFGTHHEQWGCVHMLRGHNGDVLDLSWSPDQKYLASCSVDNSIIIWNAKNLPQKFTIISGHRGLVKGLAWDPVGKYIASQSDDKSVRVWRTTDWKEEKQITQPFKKCGGTTHVLRLSWSPDGKYIVSAHALNNDGPTAQIIERADWKTRMDFVGHRKAVEVVCFNPHLFMKSSGPDDHGCLAIGSRDRSLSVWLTNLKRPLVVTHDLFSDSILDLSWSMDGYELMVCSTDGSVAYIGFSEKELGIPLQEQAMDDLFVSVYGSKRSGSRSSLNVSSEILIEDPEMLKLHADAEKVSSAAPLISTPLKEKEKEGGSDGSRLDQSMELVSNCAEKATITKQIETRTQDGRRRITPVMLTSQPISLSSAPLPFTTFSPKQNKGGVVTPRVSPKEKSEQAEAPSLKSPPAKPISFEPLSPKSSLNDPKTRRKLGSELESHLPAAAKSTSGTKRQLESEISQLPKAKRLKKTKATAESTKPSTPQRATHSHSKFPTLPAPELEPNVTVQIARSGVEREPWMVELDNSTATGCFVTSRRGEAVVWSASLSSQGLLAAGNQFITCVACKDKSVAVYSSPSGRLLLAKFMLPSLPFAVKMNLHCVMIVTCNAQVSVWDMLNMKATVKEVSFSHLLEGGRQLQSTSVTKTGVPVISFASVSYLFHRDMETWMEVSNSSERSDIKDSEVGINPSISESMPLLQIQKSASARCDSIGQMLSSLRGTSNQSATLTYLESQISRSLCLQSPLEYQHWTKSYVRYLVRQNLEEQLREFCMKFTEPSGHSTMVLGFQREVLLRDFLAIVASNVKLQRLYCELRDSLETS